MYADQTAVLGPLATYAEPHAYDLCDLHSERLSAPRGWEVLRLAPDPSTRGPSSDDLLALADAVREAARPIERPAPPRPSTTAATTRATAPSAGTCACSATTRPAHARVRVAADSGCAPTLAATLEPPTSAPSSRRTTSAAPSRTSSTRTSPEPPAPRSSRSSAPRSIVVGHDMRPSSPGLAGAFAAGATAAGADVVMIGLASTDQLYFASGHLGHAGVMFTASHNPAAYNGMKMCRAGAVPDRLGHRPRRDPRQRGPRRPPTRSRDRRASPRRTSSRPTPPTCSAWRPSTAGRAQGRHRRGQRDGRTDRTRGLRPHRRRPRRAGADVLRARRHVPPPRGQPDRAGQPRRPPASGSLEERADIGLAFDGDADRCFLVDEQGAAVSPSTLTALIASRELAKEPGATIIHNLITSRAVPEIVTDLGGAPVRTRVGHSYIKATMAETGAIFGGEHSGHFYFRDFWRADSGMLAALHALAALAETEQPLSALLADYERYVVSGEINSTVADQAAVVATHRGGVRRPRGRHHRPPRRAHGQPRRLVVQRPPVQHRAAAAAQRRRTRPRHHGADPRRGPHHHQE